MERYLDKVYRELRSRFGEAIQKDVSLSRYTSFGVGGPASIFVTPSSESHLLFLVKFFTREQIPFFVLGRGTNILVSDSGFDGAVISLGEDFKEISFEANLVWASSSVPLQHLVEQTSMRSLTGFEALTGIPGSVGGALKMNAGAWGFSISQFVRRIVGLRKNGESISITPKESDWTYRGFVHNDIIFTKALFELQPGKADEIKTAIAEYSARRHKSQPVGERSAGCVFKNPEPDMPAAKIIDQLGLKGERIGEAYVSSKHANFIVAHPGATARDIYLLMRKIQKIVRDKTGIYLEPEIILLGEFEE